MSGPAKAIAIMAIAMLLFSGTAFAQEENKESSEGGLIESFTIIVREGLEAILIIAAIIAYLVATKHEKKVSAVYYGAGLAIIASIATALILEAVFASAEAPRETLEGATMLLAAGVMLYVTNWFLGKMEHQKWAAYIKGKVSDALSSQSVLALGAVSFLAVYREGFETVLFYKALTSGATDLTGITAGFILGIAALAVLFVLIVRIEKRLPLHIVFGATSAILFLLSVKFAGKGVHELQEAGIVSETALGVVPKISDLGIYPTAETLGIQALIIATGAALVYLHFFSKPKN